MNCKQEGARNGELSSRWTFKNEPFSLVERAWQSVPSFWEIAKWRPSFPSLCFLFVFLHSKRLLRLPEAAELLEKFALEEHMSEFLTLDAYDKLVGEGH